MAEPIVVYGGGGHGRVVIEALRAAGELTPVAVIDPGLTGEVDGVPVRGGDDAAAALRAAGVAAAAIGVGSVGDPAVRRRLHGAIVGAGFALPPIVHPRASVASSAASRRLLRRGRRRRRPGRRHSARAPSSTATP